MLSDSNQHGSDDQDPRDSMPNDAGSGQHPPIDAVITWVDGADPAHKKKLETYLDQIGGKHPSSADPTRFNDAGEIDYCVVSLLKFAPWIRTIFIVTDAQAPQLMQKVAGTPYEHRIKLIDHQEIFRGYEDCLPTFNSNSIVAMLWRIRGLSENFLFLNDDFFLIRAVEAGDFFRGDKVVLRGGWHRSSDRTWYKKLAKRIKAFFLAAKTKNKPKRVGFIAGQELSAKLVGFTDKYFQLPHNPHPWKVSTLTDFFAKKSEVLHTTIKSRLRSAEQFIGESVAAHLELSRGNAVIDNHLKTLQIKPASQFASELRLRLWWADINSRYAFGCVQSLERGSMENQAIVIKWLGKYIGDPELFWQSAKDDAVNVRSAAKNA